jgi:hypothetical protein
MQREEGRKISDRWLSYLEIALIVLLAIVPLFNSFPYRVNIFLSWEGAYRLSQGEIPYRDFGMPLGYMYWVIPSIFFKLLGTQLITLVKAQVFINIISGLAFRSILRSLRVQPGVRFLSVLLYCISFSFFNFWPWYNHTVIVYQFVGLAFLLRYISTISAHWILLSLAAVFGFFSFFTKQDAGALGFFLSLALLIYHCLVEKKWKALWIYLLSFIVVALFMILPLTRFNFSYWFNLGQPPHTARISFSEIVHEFFYASQWIKFYLFLVMLIAFARFRAWKDLRTEKNDAIFLLLTLGILAEAAIFQVTSYTPPDNNIFFHSFSIAFILSFLSRKLELDFSFLRILFPGALVLLLWWSGVFWGYIQRITDRLKSATPTEIKSNENIVNRQTYMIHPRDTAEIPFSQWRFTGLKSFDKIYLPGPTVDGIHRLMNMEIVKDRKNIRVLNLTELTPLAVELPYETDKGPEVPLWHHLGVGMFNKEAAYYQNKITAKEYDLVMFEFIPSLNNFFPFVLRDALYQHYQKHDEFPAPRRGDTKGVIEVFIKR